MSEHFDFLIVCGQRSGSHFLGTCLAGHSQICMRGEISRRDVILRHSRVREDGQRLGSILMYSNFGMLREGNITIDRVIHLIRDAEAAARSRVRNAKMKKLGIGKAHVREGETVPAIPEVDEETVRRVKQQYLAGGDRAEDWLLHNDVPHIVIEYETLTRGGQEVNGLDEGPAKLVLDFLGLEYEPLTSKLRVTGYGKKV